MKSFCSNCKTETFQKVLFEKEKTIYYDPNDDFIINCYQLVECEGCGNLSYRTLTRDKISSESAAYTHETPWSLHDLHPKPANDLSFKKNSSYPPEINIVVKETVDSFNANCRLLCASGIRTIIECIYSNKKNQDKSTNKSIQKKIDELTSEGIITKKNSETLHSLRIIGNKALHEFRLPTKTELRIALEIIEITLQGLYQIESYNNELTKTTNQKRK